MRATRAIRSALVVIAFLGLGLSACATEPSPTGTEPSRGKSDGIAQSCADLGYDAGCDICEIFDWYSDGQCDEVCLVPDPDCTGTSDAATGDGGSRTDAGTSDGGSSDASTSDAGSSDAASDAGDAELLGCGAPGVTCADGDFCERSFGLCGVSDNAGICVSEDLCWVYPSDAPRDVCGCNGTTYANPCQAQRAGQSVDYDGACGHRSSD